LSAHDLLLTPPRRPTNIPAVVTILDERAPQQHYNANIVQLSHVGVRLESASSLRSRTRVMLVFTLPGHNAPLTIQGRVLSCESIVLAAAASPEGLFAVEVQFADLSHTDLARLKAWTLQSIPPTADLP
jgi:hypothetical protein